MSNWICPDCEGGFPAPNRNDEAVQVCPWCGRSLEVGWARERKTRQSIGVENNDPFDLPRQSIRDQERGFLDKFR